jgi:predicted nucleic acid-binding Zn ribbon protein
MPAPEKPKCVVCNKGFPARGIKKTCSPECARELRLEWKRRDNQKKAAKRPKLICATPDCGVEFEAYKNSKFCPKHRGTYNQPHHKEKRRATATAKYWKDPKKARAKNNAKAKAARANDPVKWRAKRNAAYHAAVAKNPEKVRAQQHASYRRQFEKDPEKFRARGNAGYHKNAEKVNARLRAVYASDLALSRAKERAKQKSRQERHPRRFRALARARDAWYRAKAAW